MDQKKDNTYVSSSSPGDATGGEVAVYDFRLVSNRSCVSYLTTQTRFISSSD